MKINNKPTRFYDLAAFLSDLKKQNLQFEPKTKMMTKEKKRNSYLFSHLDDNIRIAAANITNGKIETTNDANAEKSEQILH